jgi:hypothetical protein
MQWTNDGSFGPGSNWIRTEYGRRNAWLVHDQAIGGTRTFARIDPPLSSLRPRIRPSFCDSLCSSSLCPPQSHERRLTRRCSEHAPRSRPLLHTTFAPCRLSAVPAPVARVAELCFVRRRYAHPMTRIRMSCPVCHIPMRGGSTSLEYTFWGFFWAGWSSLTLFFNEPKQKRVPILSPDHIRVAFRCSSCEGVFIAPPGTPLPPESDSTPSCGNCGIALKHGRSDCHWCHWRAESTQAAPKSGSGA